MGDEVNKDLALADLAVVLRNQVSGRDPDGVAWDTVQTCIDLGYPIQAIETAVDFLGADRIEPAVLARLRRLVGAEGGSSAAPPIGAVTA